MSAAAERHLPHDWYPDPLPANVALGEGAWIYSTFAFLHHRAARRDAVRVGRDTGLYYGTTFVTGPDAVIDIGEFGVVAGPTISTNGRVEIGHHALISYGVTLCGSAVSVPGDEGDGDIFVGDDVWIGARATLLPGARIGDGAIVAAQTVVDFEVPAGALVAGQPARIVRRAQREGRFTRRAPAEAAG